MKSFPPPPCFGYSVHVYTRENFLGLTLDWQRYTDGMDFQEPGSRLFLGFRLVDIKLGV